MFAIGKVLKKMVIRVQPQTFTSISIYDIQEFTVQEPTNNKVNPSNVFNLLSSDDEKDNNSMNKKTFDEIKQNECMYHLAKP
tara:strand:- start:633 stop:878 length:246 start_codon:yes stop_codon:yes gene_type:complete